MDTLVEKLLGSAIALAIAAAISFVNKERQRRHGAKMGRKSDRDVAELIDLVKDLAKKNGELMEQRGVFRERTGEFKLPPKSEP